MSVVRYIGEDAEIYVPSVTATVVKGATLETTEERAAVLLLDTSNWEAADEATAALQPQFPTVPIMRGAHAGEFDPARSYPSGVTTTDHGVNYYSRVASHGETPSLAPHVWRHLGPTTAGGVPGIMMPMLSLGSPFGLSGFAVEEPDRYLAYFSRAIIPKTGLLSSFYVANGGAVPGAKKHRVAVYDTGQAASGVYTRIAQSATVAQTLDLFQSMGNLGAPHLTAGQHVLLALAADRGNNEEGAQTYMGTYAANTVALPSALMGGRTEGKVVGTYSLGEAMTFPTSIAEAELELFWRGIHMIAGIG